MGGKAGGELGEGEGFLGRRGGGGEGRMGDGEGDVFGGGSSYFFIVIIWNSRIYGF